MSGLRMAALYGFKPYQLGLCGPRGKEQTLKDFLKGRASAKKAGIILQKFKGAYPYYCLIAKSNRIKDPFNQKVVEAYWIGNKLLDSVKVADLRQTIIEDFSGQGLLPKEVAIKKAAEIPEDSQPHHSFHVVVIGSVTGSVDFTTTKLKDLCRIAWGRVEKIKTGKILVKYQPLIGKKEIKLGKPMAKEFFRDEDLLPEIKKGDLVSIHWGQIVQVLSPTQIKNLEKCTRHTLLSLRLAMT